MKNSKRVPIYTSRLKPEVRAFIYQQISEFEPYFLPDSNVGVEVQQDKRNKSCLVTLSLSGGGALVQSVGRGEDVYQATKAAKNEMLEYLRGVEGIVLPEEDRERRIEAWLARGSFYLH